MDGAQWRDPVLLGDCDDADNHLVFQPSRGKYLRITQTAAFKEQIPWRMEGLKVFAKQVGNQIEL